MRNKHHVQLASASAQMQRGFERVRRELDVDAEFSAGLTAAAAASVQAPRLPEHDATHIPLITIDPPSAVDLDQALHIERSESGFIVYYAIADVAAFVEPGSALDKAAWERVQTVYLPDGKIPLHPPAISEDAASLLPGVTRPAYVWRLRLDERGALVGTALTRSMVRSRSRFDYRQVQRLVDSGDAPEVLNLLREVGRLRAARERDRGGASLRIPDQEVSCDGEVCQLKLRPPLEAEDWNAQISLLTGMAAAAVMCEARVGILRTLPDPGPQELAEFAGQARALGVSWPEGVSYGEFLRTLDVDQPAHLALMYASRSLFRGAGYTAFDGELPEVTEQAAVAAPYAHTTAPLRRLVDRYSLALCEAVVHGREVPSWVIEALTTLPEVMRSGDRRAKGADRACVDIAEAATLAGRVGEVFDATVVGHRRDTPNVQLDREPIVIGADGAAELGERVRVRVESVDVVSGRVSAICCDASERVD